MATDLALLLHSANIILVLGLLYVYVQNYRKIRSKYTIGLVVFAAFFLLQSIMGLYFDITMAMYRDKTAENAAMFLEALKAVGFAALLKISWE